MELALAPHEEAAAAATTVHAVWYVYVADDDFGEERTWGVPVSVHRERGAATDAAASRSGPPGARIPSGGAYTVAEPCNLLAFAQTGFADGAVVRAVLRGASAALLPPRVWYGPGYYTEYVRTAPLTRDERRRAQAVRVWTVYYEDRFHLGTAREAHPVAICLSAAEAEAEVARRGAVVDGGDGYLAQGPSPLVHEGEGVVAVGGDAVREVLRRVAAGEPGPVLVG